MRPVAGGLSRNLRDQEGLFPTFTFLSAEEAQSGDLREGAASEEHDKDDAPGVALRPRVRSAAA